MVEENLGRICITQVGDSAFFVIPDLHFVAWGNHQLSLVPPFEGNELTILPEQRDAADEKGEKH
jgi:hypothetical protein